MMKQQTSILTVTILVLLSLGSATIAAENKRFFHDGDGRLRLVSEKNGKVFEGSYRHAGGDYNQIALQKIYQVFGAPYEPNAPRLSLRLIAFIDHLEDRLNPGAMLTITSGYRSPEYNKSVRARGGLAAKASLHQYGMAVDMVMEGVPSEQVWNTVKSLEFGGTGFYHGRTVHVDVGPARSWDEKTSGVGTGLADDNKLIGLITDYDIYRSGETLTLRFIRMTAFPIGVTPKFSLVRQDKAGDLLETSAFEPVFAVSAKGVCPSFDDIDQMADIRWALPGNLPPGRYAVQAKFCGQLWKDMPSQVATPVFEVIPGEKIVKSN